MFCSECGNFAANKAIRKLEESGQVGKMETSFSELFPATTIEGFVYNDANGYCVASYSGETIKEATTAIREAMTIVDNKGEIPVTLEIDGVVVEETLYYKSSDYYGDLMFIGNPSIISGIYEDNGKTFLVCFYETFDMLAVAMSNEGESHTVRISTKTETITPIADKYIPPIPAEKLPPETAGWLSVVEMGDVTSYSLLASQVDCDLTDEEAAAFEKAREEKKPIIVNLRTDGFFVSLVCSCGNYGRTFSGLTFEATGSNLRTEIFIFYKSAGVWKGSIKHGNIVLE